MASGHVCLLMHGYLAGAYTLNICIVVVVLCCELSDVIAVVHAVDICTCTVTH
jgi:hypothetical protein